MEAVVGNAGLGEHGPGYEHHRRGQVQRDFPHLAAACAVKHLQHADDILAPGPLHHRHQRARPPMALLVGEERVQLTARQAGLVYAQVLAQVLGEKQVLLCMRQLVPPAVVTEVLLVLCRQLLAVHAVVAGYPPDALRRRLDPHLLKNQQTPAIVCCHRP